jgi:YYY domain-containing protein
MFQLLQMWAIVEVLGFISLPLTVTVFHNLPDRGWAFSKAIGIVVLAFGVWLPLMLVRSLFYSQYFILGVLLILAALNAFALLRMQVRQTLIKLVRVNFYYIAACEIVFLGMMFLLGWIRSFVPQIQNFEMFMDEGFVAAIMRSPHFPPNDMWYAGQPINYYYYAHFSLATLAKLIGQIPSVAFNTGICTFFGLTAINLFGVSSNIVAWARFKRHAANDGNVREPQRADAVFPPLLRAAPFGFLSMLMGLVLGNLAATQQWWEIHGDLSQFNWWNPSRVIPDTINEFPAFSFVLSCFHAHVLTLAFTIVAIALVFNLFLEHDGKGIFAFGRGWRLPFTLGTTALLLGGLFVMNGWDLPTYVGIALICLCLQQWLAYQSHFRPELLLDAFSACAALLVLVFILYAPFYLSFISPSQGIGIVTPAERTPIADEILIYGVFAFMFLSLLLAAALRRSAEVPTSEPGGRDKSGPYAHKTSGRADVIAVSIVIVVAIIVFFVVHNSVTLVIAGVITAFAAILILKNLRDRALAFTLLIGGCAFGLIALCELFYLRDVFVGSEPRMNTVFKFYFESWALLSVTCGAGLYFVLDRFRPEPVLPRFQRRIQRGVAWIWVAGFALLLVASAAYPIGGSYARTNHFSGASSSLDGMNYLQTCSQFQCGYNTSGDYYAIRWINSHISGDPVIVEAVGNDYSMYGRISIFTGLPTIMGWVGHEYQWRVNWLNNGLNGADFYNRKNDVQTIYTSPNPKVVLGLMARYHASYIYVGELEREAYPGANLQRFGAFMKIVYSADGVTIYQVQ